MKQLFHKLTTKYNIKRLCTSKLGYKIKKLRSKGTNLVKGYLKSNVVLNRALLLVAFENKSTVTNGIKVFELYLLYYQKN